MVSSSIIYTLLFIMGLFLIDSMYATAEHNKDEVHDSTLVKTSDGDQDDSISSFHEQGAEHDDDFSEEDQDDMLDKHGLSSHSESTLFGKRRLPSEAVLLGKRRLPSEAVLLGKRRLPSEAVLLGKRRLPSEAVLLGKRRLPSEAVLLGKRRLPTEAVLLGKRRLPVEAVLLGRRSFPNEDSLVNNRR